MPENIENVEYVRRGLRILIRPMAEFLYQKMKNIYGDGWWAEVMEALRNPTDLPWGGRDEELLGKLDELKCLHVINRRWREVFENDFKNDLEGSCRSYINEMFAVRNLAYHRGPVDIDQHAAERALDTMTLLCERMDEESAEEIRALYQEVRDRATPRETVIVERGLAQPESDSARGELTEGNLLNLVGTSLVRKTQLTREIVFDGETRLLPVYEVRLDELYYNDQNDRICTWITQYEAENGDASLQDLDRSIYNGVIEGFVVDSNPEAIAKTQNNIKRLGQLEYGVTLADGRVVDGNRRFTCLRRLQREQEEPLYFKTALIDWDIVADRKRIKQLELAVQHGEEARVDYDPIDYAVGTYLAITVKRQLSVEEYAASTGESDAEVRNRLEIAEGIREFLDSVRLPEQYHVARECKVYSLIKEMIPQLKKLPDEETKAQLKNICFDNVILGAEPDQRKLIRDLKSLIQNNCYTEFFAEQAQMHVELDDLLSETEIRSKEDLERFASEHTDLAERYQDGLERANQRTRSAQMHRKPTATVKKCINQLMDVNTRQFALLNQEEKDELLDSLHDISAIAANFIEELTR